MATEYDGTIHEGQTADVLKKKHEVASKGVNHWACEERPRSSEYYRGQKELLEELSRSPDGCKPPCKTCGGTGEIPDLIPITIMGKELPGNPCPDCQPARETNKSEKEGGNE